MTMTADCSKFWASNSTNDYIYQNVMSTPGDLSTASTNGSKSIGSNPGALFKPDGTTYLYRFDGAAKKMTFLTIKKINDLWFV